MGKGTAPPPGYDHAALGWYSSKRTFKRKFVCVRPKYTAAKLEGIKRHIYRLKMEQLEEERERERREREEAASKEVDEGKRKVMEEEAAKAARLAELKAKAEQLRQEKSYLFGLLKQALVEEAKRKAKEDQEEKARKEAQDKKAQEERAIQEAAQALTGATQQAQFIGFGGLGGPMAMPPEGFAPRPGVPMAAYAAKPGPFLTAGRPSFFGGAPDGRAGAPGSPVPLPGVGGTSPMHPGGRGAFPPPPGTLQRMGYTGIGGLAGAPNRFGLDAGAPRFMGMGQASQMLNQAQAQQQAARGDRPGQQGQEGAPPVGRGRGLFYGFQRRW